MAGTESLTTVSLVDERVRFHEDKALVAVVGGRQVSSYSLAFPGSANPGTNLSASTNISNTQALVRNAYFQYSGNFSISIVPASNANNGLACVTPGRVGLSNMPFYRIVNSIQMTLGQSTFTWNNVNTSIDLISMLKDNFAVDYTWGSQTVKMPDNCFKFADFFTSNRNVLASYGSQDLGVAPSPRSTLLTFTAVANFTDDTNPAIATGTFDICTPFMMAPFASGPEARNAFVRPSLLTLNVVTISDPSQMFSFCTTGTPYAVAGTPTFTVSNCACVFNYQTIDISERIPQELQCYRSYYWDFTSQPLTVNADGPVQISINQLNMSIQPELICMCVRPLSSNWTPIKPHCTYPIYSVNLNYVNSQALVVNGSVPGTVGDSGIQRFLYDLSLKNGLSYCDLNQFMGTSVGFSASTASLTALASGGMLVLSPAYDLQSSKSIYTSAGTAAGSDGGYLLSGNITANFPAGSRVLSVGAAADTQFELIILRLIPQQLFEVSQGAYQQTSIRVNGSEVIDYNATGHDLQSMEAAAEEISGSGLLSDIVSKAKSAYSKGRDLYSKGREVVGKVATFISDRAPAIQGFLDTTKYGSEGAQALDFIKKLKGHGLSDEEIIIELRKSGSGVSSAIMSSDDLEIIEKCLENGFSEQEATDALMQYKRENPTSTDSAPTQSKTGDKKKSRFGRN